MWKVIEELGLALALRATAAILPRRRVFRPSGFLGLPRGRRGFSLLEPTRMRILSRLLRVVSLRHSSHKNIESLFGAVFVANSASCLLPHCSHSSGSVFTGCTIASSIRGQGSGPPLLLLLLSWRIFSSQWSPGPEQKICKVIRNTN